MQRAFLEVATTSSGINELWVATALAAILGGYFAYAHIISQRHRARRFLMRPILDADTWFSRHCHSCSPDERAAIWRILQALAEDIGVHSSQLLPSDHFSKELRRREPGFDDLDNSEDVIFAILKEHPSTRGRDCPDRLGDLLELIRTRSEVDGPASPHNAVP